MATLFGEQVRSFWRIALKGALVCLVAGNFACAPDDPDPILAYPLCNVGDYATAEKVMRSSYGMEWPDFYPCSVHVLLNRAMSGGGPPDFREAQRLAEIGAVASADSRAEETSIYAEAIPYLAAHGKRLTTSISGSTNCHAKIDLLRKLSRTSSLLPNRVSRERTLWYSLLVASQCPTDEAFAIYINVLADLDYASSRAELVRLRASQNDAAGMDVRLCDMRNRYDIYSELIGLYRLEREGLLTCQELL